MGKSHGSIPYIFFSKILPINSQMLNFAQAKDVSERNIWLHF